MALLPDRNSDWASSRANAKLICILCLSEERVLKEENLIFKSNFAEIVTCKPHYFCWARVNKTDRDEIYMIAAQATYQITLDHLTFTIGYSQRISGDFLLIFPSFSLGYN